MSERNEDSRTPQASATASNEVEEPSPSVSRSVVASPTGYQALFEAANDAIVVIAGEQIIDCNPSAMRLFRESRATILGQPLLAFSAPIQPDGRNSREKLQEKAERAYEGWPQTFDWAHARSDGTTFFSEISLNRVVQAERVSLLAIVRDITDRKRAEEALRLSATQFEANLENTPHVAIQWYDETGRILYWNPASEAIYGWSVDEVIGKFLGRLMFTPEQADTILLSLMALGDSEQSIGPIEYVIRRKDESQGWVIATNFSIPMADNRRGFVCMAVDVTAEKLAEESLRRQEETFRALTESSIDLIMRFDERGRVLYANPILTSKMGLAVTDVTGKTLAELGLAPEFCRLWDKAFQTVFLGGNVRRLEYEHDPGLWLEWLLMPEFGAPHHVRAVIASARDVTERKGAEAERVRLTEQLQQTTKMEAVGRLAGGVAHDFNNLLTAIKGGLNLALLDLEPDSAVAEVLRDANRASDCAAGLTRQLLAFSRKQPIMPRALDLNEVIIHLQKMLSRLISEEIELSTILANDLWEVNADPGQMEQVLINLVVNAKDAMAQGGKVIIETRNVELDEAYQAAHPRTNVGRFAMLTVSDTGCGMTEDVKRHLFEPFFTTKPVGLGTGLGLATIYGAVQQAGGSIEVYSELQVGTTFRIYLPRMEEPSSHEIVLADESELSRGTETILLVEDDDVLRQLSEKMLSRLGYRVLVARDGVTAIKMASDYEGPIDVLFCDVVLPGMTGRQVAASLTTVRSTTKVLFTSGYTEDVLTKHGVAGPGVSFIAKPFTFRAIAEKLREILSK